MRNRRNCFRWPARPFATAVGGARGKRRLVRFGVHAIRMLAALCVFLAISMSPARNAIANEGKGGKLAPKILQQMQCGEHKVVITCGKAKPGENVDESDARTCLHNKVKFIDAVGRVKVVPGFGGGEGNPDSMHCGVGRDGRHYVEVLVYTCDMPSCGELVMLTEEGHEIARRIADGNDHSAEARRYDRFEDRNKIRFEKGFGE